MFICSCWQEVQYVLHNGVLKNILLQGERGHTNGQLAGFRHYSSCLCRKHDNCTSLSYSQSFAQYLSLLFLLSWCQIFYGVNGVTVRSFPSRDNQPLHHCYFTTQIPITLPQLSIKFFNSSYILKYALHNVVYIYMLYSKFISVRWKEKYSLQNLFTLLSNY
jgi:hypothetical protein